MSQQTYDIEVYNNDTYPGATFTVLVNGEVLDLTDSAIRMQVRKTRDEDAIIDLALGSGLTLTDAAAGKFAVDAQVFSCVPGRYLYDIEITLTSGEVKTYVKGYFKITGDVTHV